MATEMGSSPEMYLKTLFELAQGRGLVPISSLAGRLGHSVVSATEMVHRIERLGLVSHRPYRGVRLTAAGTRHARALLRRHRVWERFLADELRLPWESVHDLACELEHAVGEEVTDALDRRLGLPATCPHGNPIPRASGSLRVSSSTLVDLEPGQHGRVVAIHPESGPVLAYLAQRGLRPEAEVRVESIEATDGLRVVRTAKTTATLGPELASRLRIEPLTVPSSRAEATPSSSHALSH